MARNFRIDLGKLGEKLPEKVQRAAGGAVKAAAKPMVVAEAITSPEHALADLAEGISNPITAARLRGCTVQTRAHVLAIADLPGIDAGQSGYLDTVLIRARVERPDGDAEACVRQCLPLELRRIAPGSSLRALAHAGEPRIFVLDWPACAAALGRELNWMQSPSQFAWPDPDDWPAADRIEVRDNWRHGRRIEKRRRDWRPFTAYLVGAEGRGAVVDGRREWKLQLNVNGTVVTHKQRVPELARARLMGSRPGAKRLGGMITTMETIVATNAPLAILMSDKGEFEIDWEATLNQPEMRAVQ